MLPLVELNWIAMTIPDKPTNHNQKMSKNNTKYANNLSVHFLSEL